MLIQADAELLGRRIESFHNVDQMTIMLTFLEAPKDKYQHRFDHLDHFMVFISR